MVDSKSVGDIEHGDWISGWWIYPYLVGIALHCLITHWPWLHRPIVNISQLPLEPGCDHYSYLNKAVDDFEQGLDSILTNS